MAGTAEMVAENPKDLGHAPRQSLTGLQRRVRRKLLKTLGEMEQGPGDLGQDGHRSLTGLQL